MISDLNNDPTIRSLDTMQLMIVFQIISRACLNASEPTPTRTIVSRFTDTHRAIFLPQSDTRIKQLSRGKLYGAMWALVKAARAGELEAVA